MKTAGKKKPSPTFEQALSELEAIVESMEDGKLALNELVTKFEQGNKLLQICQKQLGEAELKIEQLRLKENPEGENTPKAPFPAQLEDSV